MPQQDNQVDKHIDAQGVGKHVSYMLHVSNLYTLLPAFVVNVLIAIFEILKVPAKLPSQVHTKFGR